MPSKKTVKEWGFKCLGYECDGDEVKRIWCELCREYSEIATVSHAKKGVAKIASETFVKGTNVIKKNNFAEHCKKSQTHAAAVARISEKRRQSASTSATPSSSCSSAPRQATLRPFIQRLNGNQKSQLTRKMQLAHFTAINAKSYSFYETMSRFCKETLKVDLGKGYLTDKAGAEMVSYMAQSFRNQSITDPLQRGEIRYYSVMNDGSSSAKTLDEKELFLVKTAQNGSPKFSVLSLEEPEDTNAEGLKAAMENSFLKAKVTVNRQEHEIGLCSDGASVNIALFNLLKCELGDHYLQMWCPSHRLELAVRDAFKDSNLNTNCEDSCKEVYYLFKRATLRWRLFKRQAAIEGLEKRKYKRPSGTRWVEHQYLNLESHNHNLPILIAFLDQQIAEPHNQSIKKVKTTFEGLRSDLCRTDRIIFNYVKQDILAIIRPLSKVLQENDMILPSLITNCKKSISVIGKLERLLQRDGADVFSNADIFPATSELLSSFLQQTEETVNIRTTTRSATRRNPHNIHALYHDFLLDGDIDEAKSQVLEELTSICVALKIALQSRIGPIIEDDIFAAAAVFLDTESYAHVSFDMLNARMKIIVERYDRLLKANGCAIEKLSPELETVFNHVTIFLPQVSPNKAWPTLFNKQRELDIVNIIHIAEICIAIPLSNAETERVFSFLWRIFAKDRQSMKNLSLENILILRSETDTSPNKYEEAIEMFLSVHPNGEIRTIPRRPDGYEPQKKKSRKSKNQTSASKAIEDLVSSSEDSENDDEQVPHVEDISDDDWTSSDEE